MPSFDGCAKVMALPPLARAAPGRVRQLADGWRSGSATTAKIARCRPDVPDHTALRRGVLALHGAAASRLCGMRQCPRPEASGARWELPDKPAASGSSWARLLGAQWAALTKL